MRKEDIAILDRMASSGKKHLDKNLKRLKHTHTHTHKIRKSANGRGNSRCKIFDMDIYTMANVRSCKKASMTEIEGMEYRWR